MIGRTGRRTRLEGETGTDRTGSGAEKEQMRQKRGFNVPVVVSILALIVAAWSRYDAGRSADAAEDARDAVRLEQRAWLGYR